MSNAQDTQKSGKDSSSESTKSTTKSTTKKTTSSGSSTDTSTPSTGSSTTGTGTSHTTGGTSGSTTGAGTGTTDTTMGTGTMDMTGTTTTTTTPPPPTGTMPPTTTTPPPSGVYEPYATQPSTMTSTTTTTAAEYQEGVGAEQAGYKVRPNRIMLGTGAALLVLPYAAGAIVAASNDRDYDDKLYWPVAGPWIDLADRPCGLFDCGSAEDWNQILLIGSGVAQGAGVILMLTSLAVPETRESKVATAREKSLAAAKPTVHVSPITVRGGSGIGAMGTF